MKIRNGFVSNSSSSSFLIQFHKNIDTSKIGNGLKDEINDLKDDEECADHVKNLEKLVADNWIKIYVPLGDMGDEMMKFLDDLKKLNLIKEWKEEYE